MSDTMKTAPAADLDLFALLSEIAQDEADYHAGLDTPGAREHAAGLEQAAAIEAENARRAATAKRRVSHPCGRCGGLGKILAYAHIEGGRCFACDGSGHR